MSDFEDYNSEDDADYVPSEGEQLSEEENSGDEEDLSLLVEDGDAENTNRSKTKKKGKKKSSILSRKRKGGIKLDEQSVETNEEEPGGERNTELAGQIKQETKELKENKEKKRADDLWASFISDVKPPPKKPSSTASLSLGNPQESASTAKTNGVKASADKVTITQVFDFAGEEVRVTKEVDANSKEAQAEIKAQQDKQEPAALAVTTTSTSGSTLPGLKRPAPTGSGLGSILSKIGKKQKMGTLEKSKLDWESFKAKEGINEELTNHNKGKDGYIERMAFLNRADVRQFEIERDLRLSNRGKR